MTSGKFNEVKLGDVIISANTGLDAIKRAPIVDYNTGIKCLRIQDISQNKLFDSWGFCEVEENNFNRFSLKKGDILVARTGATIGVNIQIKDNLTAVYNNGLIRLKINNEIANNKFVFYNLQTQYYKNFINAISAGTSTQPNMQINSLLSFEIPFPPLEIQEKIARILLSLDDKIELNNKINQNLERQADLLFNDLFLEDKDCIKLSEVISTTSGGTPSRKNLNFYTNGSFCWVKSKELNGTFITKTEEKINQLAIEKSSAKLLPPYSVLLAMYGATVGEYAIISKEMTCNQAICAIIPNEKYPYTYIYEYIKLSKEKIKTLAIGSAQQNISQVLIKDLPVHKNINKIKEYHFKTRNLFELIKNNQIENEKLTQLRDTLLPKLMSGEIDVDRLNP